MLQARSELQKPDFFPPKIKRNKAPSINSFGEVVDTGVDISLVDLYVDWPRIANVYRPQASKPFLPKQQRIRSSAPAAVQAEDSSQSTHLSHSSFQSLPSDSLSSLSVFFTTGSHVDSGSRVKGHPDLHFPSPPPPFPPALVVSPYFLFASLPARLHRLWYFFLRLYFLLPLLVVVIMHRLPSVHFLEALKYTHPCPLNSPFCFPSFSSP